MPILSEGSAYLDRSGRVLAADATFRKLVGLPAGDATDGLRARASSDAALATFLAGEGPDVVRLAGAGCAPGCDVHRLADHAGLLLHAIPVGAALPAPPLELALQAIALARLAGSVAHDVKNPLNAMALQLALLADKLGSTSEPLADACAGNLASLKNQIGRINEVVRRYLEVADPTPSTGYDAGALLADTAALFGHEARRRRVTLECDAAPGPVRAAGDPGRTVRLLLGLLWRGLGGTPEGGKLTARAAVSGRDVVLAIEHARGAADPALAWIAEVVAAGVRDLGGRLEESGDDGVARTAILLPREEPL